MKKLVTYCSWTGNTKKVAEAIHEQIGGDILSMEDVKSYEEYDFLALGFFVDKGFAGGFAKDFLEKIKDKEVGFFVTLGAEPDSDHAKDVLQKTSEFLNNNGNKILCKFICQGAIDPEVMEKMRKMASKMGDKAIHQITPQREKRWKEASTHPDSKDLENAKKAFSVIEK